MKRLAIILAVCAGPVLAQETPSAEGAKVYIVSPENGANVTGPVTVRFGLVGMGVAPAEVEVENTGHHHLLIDRAAFGVGDEAAYAIPADDNHKHFGKGQTEVTLELAPGTHTLQLLLGDHGHVPHLPPVMSEVVTITVE